MARHITLGPWTLGPSQSVMHGDNYKRSPHGGWAGKGGKGGLKPATYYRSTLSLVLPSHAYTYIALTHLIS